MPPGDGRLKVATDALRHDAKEWDRWSDELEKAAQTARDLTLTADDLCLLSAAVGLPGLYAQLQVRAEELAREGAARFAQVATALRHAANHYDHADGNAADRLTVTAVDRLHHR